MRKKTVKIIGWENGDDCWTNIDSPDIVREQMSQGYLETGEHGLSVLSGGEKNGLWPLWYRLSKLLRQEGKADTGSVLRGCPDLSGGGDKAGLLPGVRRCEAGEGAQMIERHCDGIAAYSKPKNKVSLGFVERG